MKGRKIDKTCEDFSIKASNSIAIETDKYTMKNKDASYELEKVKEKYNELNTEGSKRSEKIDNSTIEGNKCERKFRNDVNNSDIVAITKYLAASEIGWNAQPGMKHLPVDPNISKSGAANFGNPAPTGMPLARATYTNQMLAFLATQIDILYGMFGCPPLANTTISSMSSMNSAQNAKG